MLLYVAQPTGGTSLHSIMSSHQVKDSSKAPLCCNDKYGWNYNTHIHPKIRRKIVLKSMVYVGRKADSCYFFEIMV